MGVSSEQKLQNLLSIRRAKGFPIDDALQPGMAHDTIDSLSEQLPFRLSDSLHTLYHWRNGIPDTSEFYFLFRDHRFFPFEEALMAYQELVKYTPVNENILDVSCCFPFAGFEGSYLCLFSGIFEGYSQPILQIFEGIELFFHSFDAMLDTVMEWFEKGEHSLDGVTLESDAELRIWRKYNPGIFT